MKTSRRPTRALHLIDVENLSGTGEPTAYELADRHEAYKALGIVGADDHQVVASSPYIAIDVGDEWAGARLRVRHGSDGADLALIDVVVEENVVGRYDRVVIASGDGIFVDIVVALQEDGIPVTVVARRDALSNRLKMAAATVLYIDPAPVAPAAALEAS